MYVCMYVCIKLGSLQGSARLGSLQGRFKVRSRSGRFKTRSHRIAPRSGCKYDDGSDDDRYDGDSDDGDDDGDSDGDDDGYDGGDVDDVPTIPFFFAWPIGPSSRNPRC